MLIRHYVWDDDVGRVGHVGDLVSILSLDDENGRIVPRESWMAVVQ
jgi:hypothetical protein